MLSPVYLGYYLSLDTFLRIEHKDYHFDRINLAMGKTNSTTGGDDGRQQQSTQTIDSRGDLNQAVRDAAAAANEANGGKKGHHLIVLNFTATWCSVCRKIAPFWEKLPTDAKINGTGTTVRLYKVDVDASPDLTNFYGASALPLFIFLVDGKKVDTLVGAQQTALRKKILKHASSKK